MKPTYTQEDYKRWGSAGGKKSAPKNSKRLKEMWKKIKASTDLSTGKSSS